MLEKNIEAKCRKHAMNYDCMLIKFTSPGFTGIPDRLLLTPGGVGVFIEFKKPGGVVSPRQELVIGQLRGMGFRCEIIDTYAAFIDLLQDIMED